MSTRDTVRAYLGAIEAMDHAAVSALLHPDVQLVEHPNKINPSGMRADRAGIEAAWDRGKAVMARQTYEVRAMTVEGDRAVAQIVWTGELVSGASMRAQICSVIELRDGKIWRQEQYDCFEP
jgi:ketosteroid isomerase-like protein